MKLASIFAIAMLLPLVAAEQNLNKINAEMAASAWSSIGPDDFNLPPADGVVQVVVEPNFGRHRVVRFIATRPLRGQFLFRAVSPNGSEVRLQGIDLNGCCRGGDGTFIVVDLWNGVFPELWPSEGPTRFDVFHVEDGRLTRVSAYVPVGYSGIVPGPQLGDILSVRNENGYFQTVQGPFKSQEPLVVIGFTPVRVRANQFGQLAFRVPFESGVRVGENILTVCDSGSCSSRAIYLTPFPSQPPFPGPPQSTPIPPPQSRP